MGGGETIIGPSVKVEGDLIAVGNVVVDGMVNGTLVTDKNVTIGEKAEITADVKAANADIAGSVKGKISLENDLTVRSSAKIAGDISTGTISIESGAQINGQLQMGGGKVQPVKAEESNE